MAKLPLNPSLLTFAFFDTSFLLWKCGYKIMPTCFHLRPWRPYCSWWKVLQTVTSHGRGRVHLESDVLTASDRRLRPRTEEVEFIWSRLSLDALTAHDGRLRRLRPHAEEVEFIWSRLSLWLRSSVYVKYQSQDSSNEHLLWHPVELVEWVGYTIRLQLSSKWADSSWICAASTARRSAWATSSKKGRPWGSLDRIKDVKNVSGVVLNK
jgi:hypothetical protein